MSCLEIFSTYRYAFSFCVVSSDTFIDTNLQGIELFTESIPGSVVQVYVLLTSSGNTLGKGALFSIVISTLTTGFTSALMSFDKDVDVDCRTFFPEFYGYIPDNNGTRGRCFLLMTLISSLHTLSRSVGCSLLAASGGASLVLPFIGGEMLLYFSWKAVRGDFMYWIRVEGALGLLMTFFFRFGIKIIVDFTGCLQFR